METFAAFCLPVLFALLLRWRLAAPSRRGWKMALNTGCGFVCLRTLGSITPLTGLEFPINAVTVTIAGFGGLPGIALLALLG